MSELKDETLTKAYNALAALQSEMSQGELDALFSRLMASPERMREELKAEVIEEIRSDLQIDEDPFPCDFYTESDQTVVLGMGKHERQIKIRYLNIEDATRLSAHIPDVIRYVHNKGPSLLNNLSFETLINDVLMHGLRDTSNGKPTKFMIKLYEELAACLSTPDNYVTAGFLRACQPAQIINAIKRLVSVNQSFFIDLWHEVPGSIRTLVDTNFGRIMRTIKNLGQKVSASVAALDSAGGISSGGTTSGSISLPKNTDSDSGKSKASTSSKPSASKRRSTGAKTAPATSNGGR